MGVAGDARGDPDQHLLAAPALAGDPLEPVELVERVEHDVADAGVERLAQLGVGLGVAVQVDARRVEAAAQRQASSPPEATSQASPSSASAR